MRFLLFTLFAVRLFAAPPGIIIDHAPASTGCYIGSPSIVVLPDGYYLASHDVFGPRSAEFEAPNTVIFSSEDSGQHWRRIATLQSLFWAGLFEHGDAVYIMGTDKHHGRIVIRRSTDKGHTWTEPFDSEHGQLTSRANFHTAPTPVVESDGRLWRAFEDASGGSQWGTRYLSMMLSIPVSADLLKATNWTFSNRLAREQNWLGGNFNAWLEGNAVVTKTGGVVNVLRVDLPSFPEKAAMVTVSSDGKVQKFNPADGILEFPGGAKKFCIRFDLSTRTYWALANATPEEFQTGKPASIRNSLVLLKSDNLIQWEKRAVLLQHPDSRTHAFQYPDWQFDGSDIAAVVRTAFDDERGGAHNAHDANFLTFHRFSNFRSLH